MHQKGIKQSLNPIYVHNVIGERGSGGQLYAKVSIISVLSSRWNSWSIEWFYYDWQYNHTVELLVMVDNWKKIVKRRRDGLLAQDHRFCGVGPVKKTLKWWEIRYNKNRIVFNRATRWFHTTLETKSFSRKSGIWWYIVFVALRDRVIIRKISVLTKQRG